MDTFPRKEQVYINDKLMRTTIVNHRTQVVYEDTPYYTLKNEYDNETGKLITAQKTFKD